MAKPHFSGKRRGRSLSLYDQAFNLRSMPRSIEIKTFFQEAPEYRKVLSLFQKRKLVSKGEIEAVSRGAVTILTIKGVISGQAGGRLFKLTNAAKEELDRMQQ